MSAVKQRHISKTTTKRSLNKKDGAVVSQSCLSPHPQENVSRVLHPIFPPPTGRSSLKGVLRVKLVTLQ